MEFFRPFREPQIPGNFFAEELPTLFGSLLQEQGQISNSALVMLLLIYGFKQQINSQAYIKKNPIIQSF